MSNLKAIWVNPKLKDEFTDTQFKLKHRSASQTLNYHLRFQKMVEKADKKLADRIKFHLYGN